MKILDFNSHAHVERDTEIWGTGEQISDFNSHAHVERDLAENICQFFHVVISTHTLTWSVTSQLSVKISGAVISTHTLTWSVTRIDSNDWKRQYISTHTLTWSVT